MADDCDTLIGDLVECARALHEKGCVHVHFLLGVRDTDWIHAGGNTPAWGLWLRRLEDVVLKGIDEDDAGAIVDAWTSLGEPGLKLLIKAETRDDRIKLLREAVLGDTHSDGEGSLFGALLQVRYGVEGLKAHVHDCLVRLQHIGIRGSGSTLYDAICNIAACHSAGLGGIDLALLAELCDVSPAWVRSVVLKPLGEEAMAISTGKLGTTRHRHISSAILSAADRSLGPDLIELWSRITVENIALWNKHEYNRAFYQAVCHIAPQLQTSLPNEIPFRKRKQIAIVVAEEVASSLINRLDVIVNLGKTYRHAGELDRAIDLFLKESTTAHDKVDSAHVIRGFHYEWGVCEGVRADTLDSASKNVWLAAIALSDEFPQSSIQDARVNIILAGICVAFSRLQRSILPDSFVRARRASVYLGRLGPVDRISTQYLDKHEAELDHLNVPMPEDMDEAISWFTEGVSNAHSLIENEQYKQLSNIAEMSFELLLAYLLKRGR